MAKIIEYFTDASFSPPNKIAVVGFKIRSKINIKTEIIYDTTNTTAELIAIQKCIDHFLSLNQDEDLMNLKPSLVIYTDCLKAVFIENEFKTNNNLSNLSIKKIDGHKPTKLKDEMDKEFALVDKYTRKTLRQLLQKKL